MTLFETDRFMKQLLLLPVVVALLILPCLAQNWQRIKPLHSTRADVLKLLGKPPSFSEPMWMSVFYPIPEGRLNILYVRRPCDRSLPGDAGNWNVAPDTVLEMSIQVTKRIKVSKLKITNFTKQPFDSDLKTITDPWKDLGIAYTVQNSLVSSITYGPTANDKPLHCFQKK